MTKALQGKRALITGASKGIGAAIALAYAKEGCDVVLSSRTAADLEVVAGQARAFGVRAAVIAADVGDEAQADRLAEGALEAFGGLDIFVNNAFYKTDLGPFLDMDVVTWGKVQATNFGAAAVLLRRIGRAFTAQRSGAVILVSSIRGLNGAPGTAGYGTTKAALNSLAKTLACEWGPEGVRVNAILPGPVMTESLQSTLQDEAVINYLGNISPLKGWAQSEDIADPAVFLASDAARSITGHLLVVDRGLSAVSQDSLALQLMPAPG